MTDSSKVISLVQRKQQDNDLLESLLSEHEDALRRFLRVRLALEDDRDDIIQDVFLRLARMPELNQKLNQSPHTVRNYLITMAANLIKDDYRKEQSKRKYQQQLLVEQIGESSLEQSLENEQLLGLLKKAISGLKCEYRQAFFMNRMENKSYRQISEELGVSISTVERYITKTLSAMRKKLSKL